MLNTIKSKSISLLKYFAILPLAVGTIFVANTGELKAQKKAENKQVNKKDTLRYFCNPPEPLVIIDGVVTKNGLATIDPETVNYLSVIKIKDEKELIPYGEKGKNGVILITTKKRNKKSTQQVKAIEFTAPKKSKKSKQKVKVIKFNSPDKSASSLPTTEVQTEVHQFDKDALILVDGKEYKKPMETIDVKTIESISVLKDKSATNIYREKGKNGVILITTKKTDRMNCIKTRNDIIIKEKKTEPIYNKVDVSPQFVGGNEALNKFIAQNLIYPKKAKENRIEGKVITQFVIQKTGKITDVKVVRSKNRDLEQEAIRFVKSMPKWKPAKLKGKNVSVKYTLPIFFTMKK